MDLEEFDKWYDAEVKRITESLPDPSAIPHPVMLVPVSFAGLGYYNFSAALPASDRAHIHTLRFQKRRRSNGSWEWERIK